MTVKELVILLIGECPRDGEVKIEAEYDMASGEYTGQTFFYITNQDGTVNKVIQF